MLNNYFDIFSYYFYNFHSPFFYSSISQAFAELNLPIASQLITDISLSKIREIQTAYTNSFCPIPMFMAYHVPILMGYNPQIYGYGASAHALLFPAYVQSKRLFATSTPMPLLAKIASERYSMGSGIVPFLQEGIRVMPSRSHIPDDTRNWVIQRLPNANQYESFIRTGATILYDYNQYLIAKLKVLTAIVIAQIQYAVCLGFKIWYAIIPTILIFTANDIFSLLSPLYVTQADIIGQLTAVQNTIVDSTIVDSTNSIYEHGSTSTSTSTSTPEIVRNTEAYFDPLELRRKQEHERYLIDIEKKYQKHQDELRKLTIACLLICVLYTASINILDRFF